MSEHATLSELLDTALDLPPDERERWLEALPHEHADLKPRLRALLARAAQIETSDFLQTLPKLDAGSDAAAGDQIGPYRLVREIGVGGMGAVWLAERHDSALKRAVALKFLRAHGPREALGERLARERDILASLVHPGIARLYDAGLTTQGLPYLALEYIEGEHIDKYCRARGLDVRARLALFLQVARAVAYAHSKLVVHRDLKPANVLVSADGQAHLLDFGIAKLLEDGRAHETRLTQVAGRALTPEYASPEQIRGEPITIASDVYSLGVLLYELLTDVAPYRLKRSSRGALEDAIVEADPQRPSERPESAATRRALRGDLDAIVLKALKKKPEARYLTVNALADDIERYLHGRPVLAQPDTTWYRLGKFVARNKLGVGAAAAVLLAILGGTAAALWQMLEAQRQRDAALFQQQRAEASNDFMGILLAEVGPSGKPLTPVELLDTGIKLLEKQYGGDQRFLGRMLYETAQRYMDLARRDEVLALLARAETIARAIPDHDLLAVVQCATASEHVLDDPADARRRVGEAQRLLTAVEAPALATRIECRRAEAKLLEADNDSDGALAVLGAGLGELERNPVQLVSLQVAIMSEISELQYKLDRAADSLAMNRRILDLLERSGRGGTMRNVLVQLDRSAILSRAGEIASAARLQQQALARVRELDESGNAPIGMSIHYGNSLLRLGRRDEALALFRTIGEQSREAASVRWATLADYLVGRTLIRMGRLEEARPWIDAAETAWRANAGANQRLLNELELSRADMAYRSGDFAGALRIVGGVLERANYPREKSAPGLSSSLLMGARVHLLAGNAATAEGMAADSLEIAARVARDPRLSADVGQSSLMLAKARAAQRNPMAIEDARRALASLKNGFGTEHEDTREAEALVRSLATR